MNCTQCSVSYSSICESRNQLCTCKHLQLNHSMEIVSLQLLSKKWNHPASILVYDYLPWWQNSRHCLRSNSCGRLTAKTTCSLWCSQRCVLQLQTGQETGRQLRSGSTVAKRVVTRDRFQYGLTRFETGQQLRSGP